ncbi:MAG: hypothetical protein R6W66_09110, partial [Pelovirga sp.]
MKKDSRPVLGISVGDPGGIGPEVALKALNNPVVYRICRPVVVADMNVMRDILRIVGTAQQLN